MPRFVWVCSAVLAVSPLARAQAQGPWREVAQVGDVRVALDTSRVGRQADGTVLVWLVWRDYVGPGADQVEHQQVDCRTHRVRVISALVRYREDQSTSPAAADSTWHTYVAGSLGARALAQVCANLRLQVGARGPGRGAAGA